MNPIETTVIQTRGGQADIRKFVLDWFTSANMHFEIAGVRTSDVNATVARIDSPLGSWGDNPLASINAVGYFSPSEDARLTPTADLGIMAALLITGCEYPDGWDNLAFCGEIGPGGEVLPVNAAFAVGAAAAQADLTLVCPGESAPYAAYAGARTIAVDNQYELMAVLMGTHRELTPPADNIETAPGVGIDMTHVKGQPMARRAVELAVAGGHNMLMVGPPGEGKSLIAKCIPTIAPPLTETERIESTIIHQAHGDILPGQIIEQMPLRSVDPTVTKPALIGGGHETPYPGEVSLAHNGVLYTDEILQFTRSVLDALRTPLQDKKVSISRVGWKIEWPANFMLVAAANPCPCGYWGHPHIQCTCSPVARRNYIAKLTGPVMDRIDIKVNVAPLGDKKFDNTPSESSDAVRERVIEARAMQERRYNGTDIKHNADLGPGTMHFVQLTEDAEDKLREIANTRYLSTRMTDKLAVVARTIADVAHRKHTHKQHVMEAAQYLDIKLPTNKE